MLKYKSPLSAHNVPPQTAPPVRLGLRTKLNLFAIGLICATALIISVFLVRQQVTDEQTRLRTQGMTIVSMLLELTDTAVAAADVSALHEILDSLDQDRDIAYVVVLDAGYKPLATRVFSVDAPMPLPPGTPSDAKTRTAVHSIGSRRYLDLVAPIVVTNTPTSGTSPAGRNPAVAGDKTPVGYLQLGMSFERSQAEMFANLRVALSVLMVLVLISIAITVFFTKRLIAPIRDLMRAAGAVAAGKLDVYVPVSSSDELGLLTHTFNHMTHRLFEAQAEVSNNQRTLEEKVTQRTKELEIATAQAYKLAQHDILTGLPNRALLNQRLKQIIAQAARDGHQVACLFLDFDHFKRINDTLGHDAGDRLLQAVAQRLTTAVRESDTVARLGGDEFVVVLPGLDPDKATFETMNVITRVRESFLAPFRLGDQTPTLTCSIGVSVYPVDAADPGAVIKQADTAMYAAKDAGRNGYRFYTADMNTRVQARLQLETDMRRGLMDDEFFVVYQPQIEMASGRACGVEALLRWRDPERGVIGPSEFIPIAEESGMIQALGARVLRDACRQVMAWHRQNMMLRLAVNLSVQQLQHDSWLSVVEDALQAAACPRAISTWRSPRA